MAAETDPKLSSEDWPRIERLNIERKMLGVYVTGHPLDEDEEKWRLYVNEGTERGRECNQIADSDIGKSVIVVGAVIGKQGIKMRSGEVLYRVALEDLSGSQEVTIFPRTLEGGLEALLVDGEVICIEAAVQEDTFTKEKQAAQQEEDAEDEAEESNRPIKLTASRIYRWDASKITNEFVAKARVKAAARAEVAEAALAHAPAVDAPAEASDAPPAGAAAPAKPAPATAPPPPAPSAPTSEGAAPAPASEPEDDGPKPVRVAIDAARFNPEWVARLDAVCAEHPGEHPVKLVLGGKTYRTKFTVAPGKELVEGIRTLLAEEAPVAG